MVELIHSSVSREVNITLRLNLYFAKINYILVLTMTFGKPFIQLKSFLTVNESYYIVFLKILQLFL